MFFLDFRSESIAVPTLNGSLSHGPLVLGLLEREAEDLVHPVRKHRRPRVPTALQHTVACQRSDDPTRRLGTFTSGRSSHNGTLLAVESFFDHILSGHFEDITFHHSEFKIQTGFPPQRRYRRVKAFGVVCKEFEDDFGDDSKHDRLYSVRRWPMLDLGANGSLAGPPNDGSRL